MVFNRVFTSCRQNPPRMRKSDKDLKRELDFKDIKFLVKIKDIHKVQKKNCISISVLGFENEKKFPICISKKYLKKKANLTMSLSKILAHSCTIKHYTVNRKHTCRYCFQSSGTAEILEKHVNDCFQINDKQMI